MEKLWVIRLLLRQPRPTQADSLGRLIRKCEFDSEGREDFPECQPALQQNRGREPPPVFPMIFERVKGVGLPVQKLHCQDADRSLA